MLSSRCKGRHVPAKCSELFPLIFLHPLEMSFSFPLTEMKKICIIFQKDEFPGPHLAAPMEGLIEVLKSRPRPEHCVGTGPTTSEVLN